MSLEATFSSSQPSLLNFVTLPVGGKFVCAIHADTQLWCWGYNPYNELGSDTTPDYKELPIQVGLDAGWTAIAALTGLVRLTKNAPAKMAGHTR